jgi:WhiB family transcriptional regulator, redox-sensing transcriptional regulator
VIIWSDPRAECLGVDTSVFFDLSRTGHREMALELCRACRVRNDCLAASMREEKGDQRFGIRGGLTPDERKRLGKKDARQRKRDSGTRAA